MANKQALMNEIEALPASYIDEILHYVLLLKRKPGKTNDITLASEHSLAKEWLLPEEDAAWENF